MNIKNHTNEKLHDISKVIENPRNPNKHSDSQIAILSKIIEFQGWRIPIVVSNRSGFIVRGHGRLMSARKLGLEKVPVSFQDYESEDQEWADLIADNRIAELAEMDRSELKDIIEQLDTGEIDLDLTGFDQESLEDLMSEFFTPEEGLTDEDEIPESIVTRAKPGDLWQLGDHRLLCGDSTNEDEVKKLMDSQKADMVFTDPPYGVNVKGGAKGNKTIAGDLTQVAIPFSFDIAVKIATTGDARFYFCGSEGNLSLYEKLFDRLLNQLPRHLIWVKNAFNMKPNNYHNQYEIIYFGYKPKGGSLKHWYSGRKEDEASDVWKIKRDPSASYLHPTQKPVEIAERAIRNSSPSEAKVYEPFTGSGSTLIACEKLKRKCFGMELDPHYCDVIIQRWEDFTGKKAEKIN